MIDMMTIIIDRLPSDLLIHIASFLIHNKNGSSERIMMAGVLNNHDMLKYYRQRYYQQWFINCVVKSENIRAVLWAHKNGCMHSCC